MGHFGYASVPCPDNIFIDHSLYQTKHHFNLLRILLFLDSFNKLSKQFDVCGCNLYKSNQNVFRQKPETDGLTAARQNKNLIGNYTNYTRNKKSKKEKSERRWQTVCGWILLSFMSHEKNYCNSVNCQHFILQSSIL